MPARLRDLKRAAAAFGVTIEEPKSGGSHWMSRKPGCRGYPVPAHNGLKTEVDDNYLRGICRHYGLELDELKKLL